MNSKIILIITAILLSGCSSIDAYTENHANTQVSFSKFSSTTDNHIKNDTRLKVVESGTVSGRTLLYSANGISSATNKGGQNASIVYPLWINESEVEDVEFAIEQYRQWRDRTSPDKYASIHPVNEYISEWMNGVTFKFGLINDKKGKAFLSVCYEFSELGRCTFTYMIDERSVELLADDLDKFKLHSFELFESES